MATHGTLTAFDSSTTSWRSYVQQLDYYFIANEITSEKKKVAILLSACGQSTFKTISSLVDADTLKDIKFGDLIKLLSDHYDPAPSSIVQQYKFYKRVRTEGESIANFVAALREIAKYCDYGDTLNIMLRDRLVCGVNHQAIQKRLLAEKNLTLEKALEIALAIEAADNDVKQLQQPATTVMYQTQSRNQCPPRRNITNPRPTMPVSKPCYRCRGNHAPQTCRFKETECHKYKKVGHIAKACQTIQPLQRLGQRQPTRRAHYIADTSEPEPDKQTSTSADSSYNLFTVTGSGQNPIIMDVTLNQTPIKMELDTGASLSLINKHTFDVITDHSHTDLRTTDVHLKTYTGEALEILGEAEVMVNYGEEKQQLVVYVVTGNGPNLMGRDWLSSLRVSIGEINSMKVSNKPEVSNKLAAMLQKHDTVFTEGLGTFTGGKVTLHVNPQAQPKFFKARTLPFSLKEKVETELKRLESLGIITPVKHSNWAAPVVPVLKQNNTIRLCGDYRVTVNQACMVDKYPLPRVEELFAAMTGGKVFSKLDMSQAYLQLQLDEKSTELVTINTHRGLFKYNRLPFGVASAPGVFQRCMESLFQGCKGVSVYLDDILVTGQSVDDHFVNLDKVLGILATSGLKLNKEKCAFMLPRVEYLGHVIDESGLDPTKEKVKAIQEAPQPHNVTELRSFLGIINYYSKFLPNLSVTLSPLYHLLKKGVKWQWNEQHTTAFAKAKSTLQDDSLLVHYDSTRPLVVACDASPYGLGAVLSHIMDDGQERPVAYASRTLTSAEKNYSQLEKEALGVVFAVQKFHKYLYGRHFVIESDHRPLSFIFSNSKAISPTASARIIRWTLTLSAYSFTIRHKPGKDLGNADALSRLPQPQTTNSDRIPRDLINLLHHLTGTTINASNIRRWTDTNPILSRVRQFILQGWPNTQLDDEYQPFCKRKAELSVLDGCVLWGSRVVVPPPGRQSVLEELHDTHLGASKMKSLARAYIWWPKMDNDIENLAKSCPTCQQTSAHPSKAPLHPWEWPSQPWSRLHLDFAGPFLGHMYLVLVDAHSKWLDVQMMQSTTSESTIRKLQDIFAIHGLPHKLVTDNGTAFTSTTFKTFMDQNGIIHIRSAPYHPSTNGLAERAVQTFKQSLRQISGGSIKEKLAKFLFKYRITPHSSTGIAPSELLMGRRLRSRLDLLKPDLAATVANNQLKQKLSHDNSKPYRTFTEGDAVYVEDFTATKQKWIPGTIQKTTGPLSYDVELLNGSTVKRHVDSIRARHSNTEAVAAVPEDDDAYQLIPSTPTDSVPDPVPPETVTTSRPVRNRRPPVRFGDVVST